MTVKRWFVGGRALSDIPATEVVAASDYDALAERCENAEADCKRWHVAFMEAKYPDLLPTRVDLEKRIVHLESLLRRALDTGRLYDVPRSPNSPFPLWQEIDAELLP